MKRFDPHGNAEIEVRGRIVVVTPAGPGNHEEIQRVLAAIAQSVASLPAGPWGILLVAKADMLMTPDAEAAVEAALPALNAAGHAGTAIAAMNRSSRIVMEAQFRRAFGQAGAELAVFDSEDHAQTWLLARL